MTRLLAPLAGGDDAHGLDMRAWTYDAESTVLVAGRAVGAQSLYLPSGPPAQQFVGARVQAFGGDFFERVHYSWLLQDFGNVVGLQTVNLYVWNAFFRAERLLSVTATTAEGVSISGGPPSIPHIFPALSEVAFTFQVGTDGPATLNASYAFDWTTADATVQLVGSRITAWPFEPDWTNGVVERAEWLTDVLQAFNAKEQRRALRIAPRKTYEFEFFAQGAERRYAESVLWGWGGRNWALPIWPDSQSVTAALAAGATEIMCQTAGRDFAAGSLALLILDGLSSEAAEVAEVLTDRIRLARGLTLAWPAGSRLYPARIARIQGQTNLGRWSSDASGARMAFEVMQPVDHAADAGATTYRGYPVLTLKPNWTGGLSLDLQRKLDEVDAMTGLQSFDDESGLPAPLQRMRWTLTTRAEVDSFRSLLYALRGRQGAAWVPTWCDDLVLSATIGVGDPSMDVSFCGYARQVAMSTGRRDVRIETTAGQVFYRRIIGAEVLSASAERLSLDTPLGVQLLPSQVLSVSFMALMRLESDVAELAHWTDEVAEVALAWRGYQHDV